MFKEAFTPSITKETFMNKNSESGSWSRLTVGIIRNENLPKEKLRPPYLNNLKPLISNVFFT